MKKAASLLAAAATLAGGARAQAQIDNPVPVPEGNAGPERDRGWRPPSIGGGPVTRSQFPIMGAFVGLTPDLEIITWRDEDRALFCQREIVL